MLRHHVVQVAFDRQGLVHELAEVLPLRRVAQEYGTPAAVQQRPGGDNEESARAHKCNLKNVVKRWRVTLRGHEQRKRAKVMVRIY